MSDSRETTIHDLLEFLRSQAVVIVVAVVCAVAAATIYSARQAPKYSATASLSAVDPGQDFALVGGVAGPPASPASLAQTEAQVLFRPEILQAAAHRLSPPPSVASLAREVAATTQPASGLISVAATTGTPATAAATANAVAQAAVDRETLDTRQRFKLDASEVAAAFRALPAADRRNPATQADYNTRISRLTALGAVASPLILSERAKVPTRPTSPSRLVIGVIAAFVGLLIGLALASMRRALDSRLRGATEIESLVDLPVVGHVSAKVMGKAGISGASPNPMPEIELEGFHVMRASLAFLGSDRAPIKTVLITSPLPQEGKSTVAASLALALAQSGQRTLLLDCDFRRPSLAAMLALVPSPGLVDLLADTASRADVTHVLPTGPQSENGASPPTDRNAALECIVAGYSTGATAQVSRSARLAAFLREARETHDVVVIDSAPLLPVVDTLELLPLVDAAILCIRDGRTTREQARAAIELMANMHERPVAMAVTGTKPTRGGYGYGYGYSYRGATPPPATDRSG